MKLIRNLPSAESLVRVLTYAIIIALLAAAVWISLDQPGAPFTDTTGVVETVGRISGGDNGPSKLLATVRLADGTLVHANVSPSVVTATGQVATVRVYRRVFSGNNVYQITGIQARQ